jgi:hypothetical protein
MYLFFANLIDFVPCLGELIEPSENVDLSFHGKENFIYDKKIRKWREIAL